MPSKSRFCGERSCACTREIMSVMTYFNRLNREGTEYEFTSPRYPPIMQLSPRIWGLNVVSAPMTFLQRLTRAYMAAFLALLAVATVLGGVSALNAALAETSVLGVGDSFTIVFSVALAFGAVPAFFLGAPGYAWLWHTVRASWLTATGLGVALGVPWFFADLELGGLATAAGAGVALTTHAICRGGAYSSFRLTPPRGADQLKR